VTYAPDFTGNLGLTYSVSSIRTTVEYTGSLTGPKRMPDLYVETFGRDRWSPTFTTHDLKVTKTFRDVNGADGVGVDAYLSVENVFDYTQGTPLVGQNDPFGRQDDKPFDTIYTWGPVLGRTFSVGVRMQMR
jgi:outer membrane receptor for ferrienterochelin and colicins